VQSVVNFVSTVLHFDEINDELQ